MAGKTDKNNSYENRYMLISASKTELRTHRKEHIRIYGYASRLIAQLAPMLEGSQAAYALFDPDGYLLKLVASDDTLNMLESHGIVRGTIWSREYAGFNAVSLGIETKKTVCTAGEENESITLKDFAVYFSPILVRDHGAESQSHLHGGFALLIPAAQHNRDYLMTVFAAANDVSLHIHIGDFYYRMYESSVDALLVFDISTQSKKVHTLYHSETIFEVLGIPPTDIYFRSADSIMDPLPQNKEFWDIIYGQKCVKDRKLTLSVLGVRSEYIISTSPYHQPDLNVNGIIFMITTPQRLSAQVSKQIGNSAVRTFDDIIGESPEIREAIQKGKLLASSDSNMMLLGESGVGKDVFAQAIHNTGKRKNSPFIAVNCGALPRDLIASELFGYDGGAFTGAKRQGNIGKFELANGGTLFLDEIGELPLDLQAMLLRAVEQKKITRIGGSKEIDVDVRIISATNIDIQAMIAKNRFRADLYYRLSTLRLTIPPLREREDDVIVLAEYFIRAISARIKRNDIMKISEEAKNYMRVLPWRGNVRELQNLIECIVQMYDSPVIELEHIQKNMDTPENPLDSTLAGQSAGIQGAGRKRRLLTEREIRVALEMCGGNRSEAAKYLGIGRRTLYSNIERLNMKI